MLTVRDKFLYTVRDKTFREAWHCTARTFVLDVFLGFLCGTNEERNNGMKRYHMICYTRNAKWLKMAKNSCILEMAKVSLNINNFWTKILDIPLISWRAFINWKIWYGFYQNMISNFAYFLFQSDISHKQRRYGELAILFHHMLGLLSV